MSSTKTRALTFQQSLSHLHEACRIVVARFTQSCRNQNNFSYQMRCRATDTRIAIFNRFLVNLDKCAASRCHVTLDSREHSDISDDEHRAVNVASHAPLTRGRVDTETCRCQVDRSDRPVYPGSLQRCLPNVLDSAADRIGRLALFLCDHTD